MVEINTIFINNLIIFFKLIHPLLYFNLHTTNFQNFFCCIIKFNKSKSTYYCNLNVSFTGLWSLYIKLALIFSAVAITLSETIKPSMTVV